MKYESAILKRLIDTYGVVGNPQYISEIIKEFIVQGKECYPNLFTYQSDWLAHIDEFGLNPSYTVTYTGQSIYAPNTLERPVKSAILKGSTKYRDIDTGEILEAFEEGRNLELVSVKMPVLTTSNEDGTKTNILTVNEDVTLRGIGDVNDELNLLTGEVVERTGFLKSTDIPKNSWYGYTEHDNGIARITYMLKGATKNPSNSNMICDKYLVASNTNNTLTISNIALGDTANPVLHLRVPYNLLSSRTLQGFIEYVEQNPFNITYKLATDSVKTVVLNPSGTLASETPYMWKNGSIKLSSDGLVPGLDYAVTTSRVGVIENNMNETITNEKRIHALEVILAQSTIAAAADAVSLQSDLESTTMSTDGAQLETENTQDNFLYEMILLLIENNAHDESLFDKVCMFYLYGKLSDEQFTNIYNLLYPVNQEEE